MDRHIHVPTTITTRAQRKSVESVKLSFHRIMCTQHPKAAKQIDMSGVQKWQLHWTFYFPDKCHHPKQTDSFQRGLH